MLLATSLAAAAADWPHVNGNPAQVRYAEAAALTPNSVKSLRPKYLVQTGVLESMQAAPVIVGDRMYLSTAYNLAYAIDARTGAIIWEYEHPIPRQMSLCCGPNNRGVAVADGKVFMGTVDSELVALDAETGELLWREVVADRRAGYSITMAPAVADGRVLVGVSGGEFGIRGFLAAFDAATGERAWTFHTTTEPSVGVWATQDAAGRDLGRDIAGEKQLLAEIGDPFERLGGGIWQTPAVDSDTGRVYFTVGNPSPTFDDSTRPGDNLYTNSLVALDGTTGEYICHFQYVPHDVWDFDAVSPPVLTPVLNENGQLISGVLHAGKTGFVYVHDAADCSLVRISEPLVPQLGSLTPPTAEGTAMSPGSNGGVNWSPLAVDPERHLAFALTIEQPMTYRTRSERFQPGAFWFGGMASPDEELPASGAVVAVNYNTGAIAWRNEIGIPMIGGSLATRGGLLFVGDGNGWFHAFDSTSGDVAWKYYCGAGVNAPPAAFSLDGQDHVAVAAGGNFTFDYRRGNSLLVFALP